MMKSVARKILPPKVRWAVLAIMVRAAGCKRELHLARMRWNVSTRRQGSEVRFLNWDICINDGLNFYMMYKDIFIKRIYHFESQRADPLILDCGSNIGVSILYFKHVYPQARIIGFEPDPAIYPYLKENVTRNGLTGVNVVQAALAKQEGMLTFYSDGKYGSCLAQHMTGPIAEGWTEYEVPSVRLGDYLTETVDFLKMNVEGAEWEVLADCEDRLRQVRELVIEYHHLPGLPRTLHNILELLHRQGFEYLVNDFDSQTNPGVRPPFHLSPETRYYVLIYAKRMR